MKDTPASTSEKTFISQTVKINQRLDGRKIDEYRTLNINFGADWGSVLVALGETRVIGQVTCELGQPKATRPNEGILFINVELSAMSGVSFDTGRIADLTVQVNRILEKTFKESRCVDLESLCVTAEDRVWVLRLDLNVLNHEGNLTDCCSVAALAALAHFKRPDVSVMEDEVKIHTAAEKELIPTVLHHYPVCVSYCTFNNGETAVADPSAIEELTAEATLVFGINSYREVCCLNLGGGSLCGVNLLLQCAQRSAQRAKLLVDEVKRALEEDTKNRDEKKPVGFTECLKLNKFTTLAEDKLAIKLRHFRYQNIEENNLKREPDSSDEMEDSKNVVSLGENTGILNSNQKDVRWVPEETDSEENVSDDASESAEENLEHQVEIALHNVNQRSNQPISKKKNLPPLSRMSLNHGNNDSDSDSEEEQKMVL